MDKEWSEKNKKMQTLISKEATFSEGINLLLELRGNLFEKIFYILTKKPPTNTSTSSCGQSVMQKLSAWKKRLK